MLPWDHGKPGNGASLHQYLRSFAVLFDEPIAGACGIKVVDLDPYEGEELPVFHTVECDLSDRAERSVTSAVTELPWRQEWAGLLVLWLP